LLAIDNYQHIKPRLNNAQTGRFILLLGPGKYNLLFTAADYRSRLFPFNLGQEMVSEDIVLIPEQVIQSQRDKGK